MVLFAVQSTRRAAGPLAPFLSMSFLPTLLLGVLMVPQYPPPPWANQSSPDCSAHFWMLRTHFKHLVSFLLLGALLAARRPLEFPAPYCLAAARLFHDHSVPFRSLASLLVVSR